MTRADAERLDRFPWPLIAFLVLTVAALAVGTRFYYQHELSAIESLAFHNMGDNGDLVARQVTQWRSERIGDGAIFASEPIAETALHFVDSPDSELYRERLSKLLQTAVASFGYSAAALVDAEGRIRLQTGTVTENKERFRSLVAAAHGHTSLSDFYLDPLTNRPWMSVTSPLPKGYAIILDVDPQIFLYPYLWSRSISSGTGETYLVREENNFNRITYLSPLRGLPNAAVRISRDMPRSLPWYPSAYADGLATKSGDYRGHVALFVIHGITGTHWYVVSKVDAAEVTAPLSRLRFEIMMILFVACVANSSVGYLVWKNRQFRYYRDRRDWFRRIASDTPAQIWTVGASGEVAFLNRQITEFLGLDNAGGEDISHYIGFFHPDDREQARAKLLHSLEARAECQGEYRVRRRDGEYRLLALRALPRFDPDHTFTGLAGCTVDITEQRAAENALREANALSARELKERTRSQQEVMALSARLITAQEEERTRLARELHDDLSQQIVTASMATGRLKQKLSADTAACPDLCDRIRARLTGLAETVRKLSHQLHPTALDHAGLAVAIQNHCSEITSLSGHKIDLRVEGKLDDLSRNAALCVYRIAQEALRNSVRHSGVNVSEVLLTGSGDTVSLVVSDRGRGMDPQAGVGLGLVSMRERSRLVGGTLEIRSKPGSGATVILKIPVEGGERPAEPCAPAAAVSSNHT